MDLTRLDHVDKSDLEKTRNVYDVWVRPPEKDQLTEYEGQQSGQKLVLSQSD